MLHELSAAPSPDLDPTLHVGVEYRVEYRVGVQRYRAYPRRARLAPILAIVLGKCPVSAARGLEPGPQQIAICR
ncbi:hypothetical protein GGTG_05955 [Gaeumannomyces tritici R3-111a-1]|uniref:Uncharacterized protein n=1 Tax=Gaeumannomyces tritici (strain R3-111a-1) TaxID=644352 RepID=J3NXE9_GAET3|nr:hypothetical protein GGTG_05955 [Gaeumannomyces tritici R3-111a-1]EJT76031.1 hypothetical protein GGTG_05955 [Gaeumannomyces tritici R3-111a-1]